MGRNHPSTSKPVICYDHAVDLVMLHFLLDGQLPDHWAFESISGRLNAARRSNHL